jgi:hypothetical protein
MRRGQINNPPADPNKRIEALETKLTSILEILRGQPSAPAQPADEKISAPAHSKPNPLVISTPERFPRDVICDRIETALERKSMVPKQLSAPLDITHSAVYKKLAGIVPFTLAEVDAIGRLIPDAPSLYPFVDWDEGLAIDEFLKTRKR